MYVCLSMYLWCNASAAQYLLHLWPVWVSQQPSSCTDASTLLHVTLGVAQQTRNRPSPGGKMLCCDFCEKMMGSKNSFESKYSSHSSAQRFNRITPMFYLTGCFDKYVVEGRDYLLQRLLEKTVWFSTVPQGNLREIAMLELNLNVYFEPSQILAMPHSSIFYHHLPFTHFSGTAGVILHSFNQHIYKSLCLNHIFI